MCCSCFLLALTDSAVRPFATYFRNGDAIAVFVPAFWRIRFKTVCSLSIKSETEITFFSFILNIYVYFNCFFFCGINIFIKFNIQIHLYIDDRRLMIDYFFLIFYLKLLIQNHIEFNSNHEEYNTTLNTIHLDLFLL